MPDTPTTDTTTITTVQLRRYRLVPEERDAFLDWWRREIPTVRRNHGFGVPFAYLVPETDEFVWAVSYDGDAAAFERAEKQYQQAPDRRAAFEGQPERVREVLVHLVEVV